MRQSFHLTHPHLFPPFYPGDPTLQTIAYTDRYDLWFPLPIELEAEKALRLNRLQFMKRYRRYQ